MKIKTGFQTQADVNYVHTKAKSEWPSILGGLSVFIVIILSFFFLLKFILVNLFNLRPEITAAIIVTSGTIFISVFTIVYAKSREHRLTIQKEQRAKKAEIYEKFIGLWFDILFSEKIGTQRPTEKDLLEFFHRFTKELIAWGGDNVIKQFSLFRTKSAEQSEQLPIELFNIFEKMLFEIRTDLGHKNKNLKKGDLLKLFITDYEKTLA